MLGYQNGRNRRNLDTLASEIAEQTSAAMLSQFGSAMTQMSEPELRGYVRAHTWPTVCSEIQTLIADGQVKKSQMNELAGRALERTVHIVTSACRSAPVIAMPTPHIGHRAA